MTKKVILLIDDDVDFVHALSRRCESIGLDVVHAHNLLSATLIAAKRVPDLLCVDVQMPTGSGLAFCESFTADSATAHVPLVVLSGLSNAETLRACEQLHARHVTKSVNYWQQLEPILRQLAAESTAQTNPPVNSTPNLRRPVDSAAPSPKTLMIWPARSPDSKQVVVADDDVDILNLLSQRLSSLNCSVFGVDNALDAINLIHRTLPDLVCLDVGMPSGNGLSICEMMASDEVLRKIPIIVLTGRSDNSTIRRCHDMLVYYVQKSADTWQRVEPLVRELLHLDESKPDDPKPQPPCPTLSTEPPKMTADHRDDLLDAVFAALGADVTEQSPTDAPNKTLAAAATEEVPWVLSIDDDSEFSDALRIRLEQHGVAVRRAFNGMEGYRLAFTSPASAILLDFNMPNGQGDYVLGRLKDNPVTAKIPVIVITGARDKMVERRMLAMGAAAFLEKPICFDRLRSELAKHIDILEMPNQPKSKDSTQKTPSLTLAHVAR